MADKTRLPDGGISEAIRQIVREEIARENSTVSDAKIDFEGGLKVGDDKILEALPDGFVVRKSEDARFVTNIILSAQEDSLFVSFSDGSGKNIELPRGSQGESGVSLAEVDARIEAAILRSKGE